MSGALNGMVVPVTSPTDGLADGRSEFLLEFCLMAKPTSSENRLPWSTPQLLRITAGSAEAKTIKGINDGAKGVINGS